MARCSERRLARVVVTARRNFSVELAPEHARGIVAWDADGDLFVRDLDDSGELDTAGLDYFGMALLEQIMPGAPPVRDGLIGRPLERWHFPLNGSSDDYVAAFTKAWRRALRRLRAARTTRRRPV